MKQGHLRGIYVFLRVVIGEDQLFVFTAADTVPQGIGAGGSELPEARIQFPDKGVIVIRDHNKRLLAVVGQLLKQKMIPKVKIHLVALSHIVGRVKVEECPCFVIPWGNNIEAEILHHHVLESPGAGMDLTKPSADVHRPCSVGGPACAVAVADDLVVGRRSFHIPQLCLAPQDHLQIVRFWWRKEFIADGKFFLEEVRFGVLLIQKVLKRIE